MDSMDSKPKPKISVHQQAKEHRGHYYRNRGFFLFLLVLRWFTSQGSLVRDYGFITPYGGFAPVGFPIRKSSY